MTTHRIDIRRIVAVAGIVAVGMVATACRGDGAPNQGGPFTGKIVDAETGKPIPGAVFVAIWIRMIPLPLHGAEKFDDAQVAVANTEGRFESPRRDLPFLSGGIEPVYLSCIAPGYKPFEGGGVEPQPNVIRLAPITEKQKKLGMSHSSLTGLIPDERRKEFDRTINTKRLEMGLAPIGFASGNIDRVGQ